MSKDALSEPAKPRWYSIQEAAAYLEVGEPTLYRWMRENKITYRKVGDSTRFWREDLDAVMEVFHSGRELESVKKTCPVCRAGQMVEGVFRTTGLNYFQPRKTKFWTLKNSYIETRALMCERCGSISHFGDTAKLATLLEQKRSGEEGSPESAATPATLPA